MVEAGIELQPRSGHPTFKDYPASCYTIPHLAVCALVSLISTSLARRTVTAEPPYRGRIQGTLHLRDVHYRTFVLS